MRKITILIITFVLLASIGFSQNKFKYTKRTQNGIYETVFTVLGIYDNSTSSDLINQIIKVEGVTDAKIFYNRRCKILSEKELDFDLIRKIVKSYNADFQIEYCDIKDKFTYIEISTFSKNYSIVDFTPNRIPANKWVFPEDFPTKENISDISKLAKAKQNWIEENPYKWRDITGVEYLDFSQKLGYKLN